jgi:ribosome biogenesis GTPase
MAADPAAAPCVGDWCVLRSWPEGLVTVDRLLPRRTVLTGAAGAGGAVLCANADLVAVVLVAVHARLDDAALDRTLDRIRAGAARPLVVVTGSDLAVDPEPCAREIEARLCGGVEVTTVRAGTGHGVPALRERLQGRLTMALTGPSDPARSALVEALLGTRVLASREVSGPLAARRRRLLPLPSGGAVIDTHRLPCDPPPWRPTDVVRTGAS